MSILIKGMEMPRACVYRENDHLITCPLYDIDGYCGALNTEASHEENNRHSACPLIEVPKHGKWGEEWFDHKWKIVCSECGCFADRMTDFCPNCGADMREAEGEDG